MTDALIIERAGKNGHDKFQFSLFKYVISNLFFKINKSQCITLFVVSGSIKKLFSIDCVNIYFSPSIVNYLFSIGLKMWDYLPQIAYTVIY